MQLKTPRDKTFQVKTELTTPKQLKSHLPIQSFTQRDIQWTCFKISKFLRNIQASRSTSFHRDTAQTYQRLKLFIDVFKCRAWLQELATVMQKKDQKQANNITINR